MCLELAVSVKAQQVPNLPEGWSFYFDNSAANDSTGKENPALKGLCVVSPACAARADGPRRIYHSVESAAHQGCRLLQDSATQVARKFYEKDLGIVLKIPSVNDKANVLVGKPLCRQWINSAGQPRIVFGHITKCEQDYFYKKSLYFTVEYQVENDDGKVNSIDASRDLYPVVKEQVLSDRIAWGACILHDTMVNRANRMSRLVAKLEQPFHYRWVVPTTHYCDTVAPTSQDIMAMTAAGFKDPKQPLPRIIMNVKGFELVLQAKKSAIPSEKAGLGVWVKCRAVTPLLRNDSHCDRFELRPGELVDMGVYAPMRKLDRQSAHVTALKNFIHKWYCEGYSFNRTLGGSNYSTGQEDDEGSLDITDDWTGRVHEIARCSVMPYVNETNGLHNELATVRAELDPTGAVHYMMGYGEESHGTFCLPIDGTEVELKIDYGSSYERIRVRKGYSRVSPEQQAKHKEQIKREDEDFPEVIGTLTANQVNESVKFLEDLLNLKPDFQWEREMAERTLLVAILLLVRLKSMIQELQDVANKMDESAGNRDISFCDNGFTSLKDDNCLDRAKHVVWRLTDFWQSDEALRESLFRQEFYGRILVEPLKCADPIDLQTWSACTLRTRILSLHEL